MFGMFFIYTYNIAWIYTLIKYLKIIHEKSETWIELLQFKFSIRNVKGHV